MSRRGHVDIGRVAGAGPRSNFAELGGLTTAVVRSHFIARVGGLPTRTVEALRSDEVAQVLEQIAASEAGIAAVGPLLSAELHAVIGREQDRRKRGQLLRLRRGVFRGESPDPEVLAAVKEVLPLSVWETVAGFAAQLHARAKAVASLAGLHANAVKEARSRLQLAVSDGDFQAGLLLSSRALFCNVPRYRHTAPERIGSREVRIERGLLRYLTRTAMKATPFGRFCAIAAGAFEDVEPSGDGAVRFDLDPTRKGGHVRLNKTIYGLLWTHLKTRPAVRHALVVSLNPTLTSAGGRFEFVAAVDGREVVQRVSSSEALKTVVALVRDNSQATLGGLISLLASHPAVEAIEDQAQAYLNALVSCGVLRLRSFVPEQAADWDIPLREGLARIDDAHAQQVTALLLEVRTLVDGYATGSPEARGIAIARVGDVLIRAFGQLGLSAQVPRDLPFFEDAATDAVLSVPRSEAMQDALAHLAQWVALTQPLSETRVEQIAMRRFYESQYGDINAVPLLRFYEDHFRMRPASDAWAQSRALRRGSAVDAAVRGPDGHEPFGCPRAQELRDAIARLHGLFRSRWAADPGAESIRVDPEDVRLAVGALAEGSSPTFCRSVSAFVQVASPVGSPSPATLVLPHGQYFVGFGKYLSRFLYMLPEQHRERVFADNSVLGGLDRLAEICDDAHFNANLHPPLLPWEISYPTGEDGVRVGQLESVDLCVGPDPNDAHALALVHQPSGARVLPVDLGFLNVRLRPPMYQLLARFGPSGSFAAPLPDVLLGHAARAQAGLVRGSADPNLVDTAEDRTYPGAPVQAMAALADLASHVTLPEPVAPGAVGVMAPEDHRSPGIPAVVYRPRLVFGDHLVIARRRWSVPSSLMPRQRPDEHDAAYMLRLDRWRRAEHIPEEVYARVVPITAGTATTQTDHTVFALPAPCDEAADAPLDVGGRACDEQSIPAQGVAAVPDGPTVTRVGVRAARVTGETGNVQHVPSEPVTSGRQSRDWRKPQYIDFRSPLLVHLFTRLPGSLSAFSVILEERYPDENTAPRFGDARYATELVVQVDFPGNPLTPPLEDPVSAASSAGALGLDASVTLREFTSV